MARPATPHPTGFELEILKVLWRRGPSSVSEVREALAGTRDPAYTSVMTILNIMVRKGYLARRRNGRAFLYRAKISEGGAIGRIVRDLVERAFGGSHRAAMVHLLEAGDLEGEELEELRRLIDRKARKEKG